MVAIQGSIQTGSYKSNSGETHYTTEVLANKVEFLEWGEKKAKEDDDFSFGGGFDDVDDSDDIPFL